MPTREIPPNEWRNFFNTFSQLHEGWLTTVEVAGEDVPGDQISTEGEPLLEIGADKGSESGAIEITVGRSEASEFTHVVHDVERVLFERSDQGKSESIEIQSAEGGVTIVQLRPAAHKELPRTAGGA
ncbi:MAG TPA: DUF5335 family protein [Bryobacteraceae bacterium]